MITKGMPLWEHQKEALSYCFKRRGSLLWLPMGAGKSRVIVDFVQNTVKDGFVLIVCPLKVCKVWQVEFEKYSVEMPNLIILNESSTEARSNKIKHFISNNSSGVIVINYDAIKMQNLKTVFENLKYEIIVLDECHRIKSAGSITSRFIAKIAKNTKRIIGLSGTPLTTGFKGSGGKKIGGWLDIYGQARAIVPGLFGYNHHGFKNKYGIWMTKPFPKLLDDQNQDEFMQKLYSFCYHISEDELTLKLPETVDQVLKVDLPEKIMRVYRELEDELITLLDTDVLSVQNALVKQLRLQQMTSGFFQADDNQTTIKIHDEKFNIICDLISDMEESEKIVVFCKFRPEMAELTNKLKEETQRPVFHMMGGADTSDQWKKSEGGVLIVQISAGSEGVDFTCARYCIYCSLCHSLKDYSQSRKRIHRPGQKRPVTYYHILAQNTIDEVIMQALDTKEDVVNTVRQKLKSRRQ